MERQKYKRFSFRAVFSAIIFSVGLWIYASLNSTYSAYAPLKLTLKMPDNLAIENNLPSALSVRIKGDGWQLLNFLYFASPNSNSCIIDLTKNIYKKDSLRLSRTDLLNNINLANKVEVVDIEPSYLDINLGEVEEKNVPIIPNIKISTREGFTLVGNIKTEPKLVTVRGNKRALQNLTAWNTENIVLKDVYKSFQREIFLNADMNSNMEARPSKIKITAKIQQIGEKEFYDIPVKIVGQGAEFYKVIPKIITVQLRGGVEELVKLDPSNIKAFLNIADIKKTQSLYLKPDITFNGDAQFLKSDPEYVKVITVEKEQSKNNKYEKNK